jgi:hypothetical protein
MNEELIFAEPPPRLNVAGVTDDTVDWAFDCNEISKNANNSVFCMNLDYKNRIDYITH